MNAKALTQKNSSLTRRKLLVGVGIVLVVGVWFGLSDGFKNGALTFHFQLAPMMWATLIFLGGSLAILAGTLAWLERVDHHAFLRSEEKIQNKDALVIGAFFSLLLLLAYCVTGAAAAMQFPGRGGAAVVLAITWALASASVGGAFGFLLGHPRRLTEEKSERVVMGGLLRTGLDDMVDWLVKGLTTVLLVQATAILGHLDTVAKGMGKCLIGPKSPEAVALELDAAAAFAQPVIVAFTLLGALASCLVTRTYLTGALGRADRTTTGAFNRVGLDWGEVLLLVNAQRSLTSRELEPSPEVLEVAKKLAALSLNDLQSAQEFALWAKAKSMLGESKEAMKGYEKALTECDCDPALLLDYGVVLHAAHSADALTQLQLAYDHLSTATPADTRRNVYKSLTFELLYQPGSADRVIKLVEEYESNNPGLPSVSLLINKACAWGQKFRQLARQKGLLEEEPDKPIKVKLPEDPSAWPTEHKDLKDAYDAALVTVKSAVKINPAWKKHLASLLQSSPDGPKSNPEENDLQAFERFNEFRFAVDLPPFSEKPPVTTSEATAAGATSQPPKPKDRTGNVSTENADLTSEITQEKPPES